MLKHVEITCKTQKETKTNQAIFSLPEQEFVSEKCVNNKLKVD